ncbi:MAG TPA: hypothetical protein VH208_03440 [Myxococcaceae bacterium]|nr:hypothetical protein [Myxococcaceae bacterium]
MAFQVSPLTGGFVNQYIGASSFGSSPAGVGNGLSMFQDMFQGANNTAQSAMNNTSNAMQGMQGIQQAMQAIQQILQAVMSILSMFGGL